MDGSKKHLEEVKETYFEHMGNAFKISFGMIEGGLKGAIHALVPGVFTTAASDKIKKLYQFIQNRDREKEE
tara:strand:- start:204 stop:416 length:213 start_codon:yes stop_codon:yes gene_type:complete